LVTQEVTWTLSFEAKPTEVIHITTADVVLNPVFCSLRKIDVKDARNRARRQIDDARRRPAEAIITPPVLVLLSLLAKTSFMHAFLRLHRHQVRYANGN
jgi:hypothetical protein